LAIRQTIIFQQTVRGLGRRAIRILNDATLNRRQREDLIRPLQARLLDYQAQQAGRATPRTAKKGTRQEARSGRGGQVAADRSQVLARRRDFGAASEEAQPVIAAPLGGYRPANHSQLPGHSRPVLTLRRA
jgi:hypothetical protein